jgi:hypothetical protein
MDSRVSGRTIRPPAASGRDRKHCVLAAAFRAFAAGIDARLHIANSFAAFGAILADIDAFGADMLGMIAVHQHEMRASAADFRTGKHQPQMIRFNVLASGFETMGGG